MPKTSRPKSTSLWIDHYSQNNFPGKDFRQIDTSQCCNPVLFIAELFNVLFPLGPGHSILQNSKHTLNVSMRVPLHALQGAHHISCIGPNSLIAPEIRESSCGVSDARTNYGWKPHWRKVLRATRLGTNKTKFQQIGGKVSICHGLKDLPSTLLVGRTPSTSRIAVSSTLLEPETMKS